jgi:hypothetical protein
MGRRARRWQFLSAPPVPIFFRKKGPAGWERGLATIYHRVIAPLVPTMRMPAPAGISTPMNPTGSPHYEPPIYVGMPKDFISATP